MLKWIIGIVVIALAVAALWWSGWLGKILPSQTTPSTSSGQATTTQPVAEAPTNGMSANTDASDAAILQDTTAVDAQIQGLTSDSSQIDSSLNDQSVQ